MSTQPSLLTPTLFVPFQGEESDSGMVFLPPAWGRDRVEADGTDESSVRLRVHNVGPVPAETIPVLFEPLAQITAHKNGAARKPGLGLGLFIVRSVAKRHGGRVWAESEGPGHGSTFLLQFPIAK